MTHSINTETDNSENIPADETTELAPQESEGTITEETEPEDTEATLEDVLAEITKDLPDTEIKPYGIYTVIQTALKVMGSEKEIRPQMMYNYDRNGLIVKGKKGVKRYNKDEVVAFAKKYVAKHI
jgi:hypothetical protein